MKKTILTILAATAVSTGGLAGVAYAKSDDTAEIALFQKAQHDIVAGIKAAETASGGKAVGAEFEDEDGTPAWEVKTMAGSKYSKVTVDAATGKVLKTREKSDKDAVTPEMLGAPLTDLAAKAAAAGEGKVMSIDADHEDGKFRGIEVEIVKADGSVQDFILNAADGKLTPSMEGHDDDGEAGESND